MAQFLFEDKSYLWNAEVGLVLTRTPVCCSWFGVPKDTKDSEASITILLLTSYPRCPSVRCYQGGSRAWVSVSGLKECFCHPTNTDELYLKKKKTKQNYIHLLVKKKSDSGEIYGEGF